MKVSVKEHYDLLIQEENDPVRDPPVLQEYMNQWDGPAFLQALAPSPDSRVLEIGVGTGRLARQVLKIGCGSFTGIDLSPATIRRAEENLEKWDNLSLIQGDFLTYPFSQTFDIIYASLTLFHFKDKETFVRKVGQLLCRGGRVVFSIPKEAQTSIQYGTREVELYPDDFHYLAALLEAAGLQVQKPLEVAFALILIADKI